MQNLFLLNIIITGNVEIFDSRSEEVALDINRIIRNIHSKISKVHAASEKISLAKIKDFTTCVELYNERKQMTLFNQLIQCKYKNESDHIMEGNLE